MPILPAETDIYPDDLLEQATLGEDALRSWWVMYTMVRQEKQLMRRLHSLEIPFYSPLVKHRSKSPAGRVRQSYIPLFASYVFVLADEQQRHQALATKCVSRCLTVGDGRTLAHDLRQIRQLIDIGAPLTFEARIEPGQQVRIRSGPMAGLEGTVVKRRGQDWLLVAVRFLQQGASVLLEDFQVEVI